LLQVPGVLADALQGGPEPAPGSCRDPAELCLGVGLDLALGCLETPGQLVGYRSGLQPGVIAQQARDRPVGVTAADACWQSEGYA
jgi:hypothetical protein